MRSFVEWKSVKYLAIFFVIIAAISQIVQMVIMSGSPYALPSADELHPHFHSFNHRPAYLSDQTEKIWSIAQPARIWAVAAGMSMGIIYKRFGEGVSLPARVQAKQSRKPVYLVMAAIGIVGIFVVVLVALLPHLTPIFR